MISVWMWPICIGPWHYWPSETCVRSASRVFGERRDLVSESAAMRRDGVRWVLGGSENVRSVIFQSLLGGEKACIQVLDRDRRVAAEDWFHQWIKLWHKLLMTKGLADWGQDNGRSFHSIEVNWDREIQFFYCAELSLNLRHSGRRLRSKAVFQRYPGFYEVFNKQNHCCDIISGGG